MMEEREKLNVPTGTGIVDWKAVKAAADAQWDGEVLYVVEREASYGGKDRVTCLAEDLAWLKEKPVTLQDKRLPVRDAGSLFASLPNVGIFWRGRNICLSPATNRCKRKEEVHDGPCKTSEERDKEAFILLMDHHRQMLYNTALLVLHREDDALDAIQDTILACWENLPSLQKDRYFKTWLVRILLNKCADIQRGAEPLRFCGGAARIRRGARLGHPRGCAPGPGQAGRPRSAYLVPVLYDDFSVRQIAEALSLSEGAVRTRLTRSRDRFKKSYLQEKGECL